MKEAAATQKGYTSAFCFLKGGGKTKDLDGDDRPVKKWTTILQVPSPKDDKGEKRVRSRDLTWNRLK